MESEPVNVDLECGSGDDLSNLFCQPSSYSNTITAYHDSTTGETRSRSSTSLVGRKEKETSKTDFFQVQTDKHGPEGLEVKLTTGLEMVGLVGAPVKTVFVCGKEYDSGEPGENGDDGLNYRVDDGDTEDQTRFWPDGRPRECRHFVLRRQ